MAQDIEKQSKGVDEIPTIKTTDANESAAVEATEAVPATGPNQESKSQAQLEELLSRLKQLEEKTQKSGLAKETEQKAEKKDKDEDEDVDIKDLTSLKKSRSRVNYLTIDEYSKRKFSLERPHDTIDAVVADDWPGLSEALDIPLEQRQHVEPIRFIQINSPALFSLLQQASSSGGSSFRSARVMLAPFKQIAFHEEELEATLKKLEQTYSNVQSNLELNKIGTTSRDSTLEHDNIPNLTTDDVRSNSFKALEDLKCLMTLYKYWVQPRWHWLRSDKVDTVTFRDLSMLYQPGDILYVPRETQKLFRIFKVTDGRPKMVHLYSEGYDAGFVTSDQAASTKSQAKSQAASSTSRWVDLHLDCYFLDFDGRYIGPVHFAWSMKPWVGRKEVTQLKAYPLRLAKDTESLTAGF